MHTHTNSVAHKQTNKHARIHACYGLYWFWSMRSSCALTSYICLHQCVFVFACDCMYVCVCVRGWKKTKEKQSRKANVLCRLVGVYARITDTDSFGRMFLCLYFACMCSVVCMRLQESRLFEIHHSHALICSLTRLSLHTYVYVILDENHCTNERCEQNRDWEKKAERATQHRSHSTHHVSQAVSKLGWARQWMSEQHQCTQQHQHQHVRRSNFNEVSIHTIPTVKYQCIWSRQQQNTHTHSFKPAQTHTHTHT